MSDSGKAVFLSYASQDAEAARRICEALRAAGIEVWFDQSELRGGDAWDQKIRRQIKECALFVPIISAHTQARAEGYFRLEWKLAVDRSHLMADDAPFLFPIAVGDVTDANARVPEKFREVQWTRLRLDETPGELAARVARLLAGEAPPVTPNPHPAGGVWSGIWRAWLARRQRRPAWLRYAASAVALILALVYGLQPLWQPDSGKSEAARAPAVAAPASPAQPLIAKVWVELNKTELARAELDTADALCQRAVALDPTDADAWAAWSQVNTWYVYHHLDVSPRRRQAAQDDFARALQLSPDSYEARLAEACYWVRGWGGQMGDVSPLAGQADRLLRELLQARPDEPRALFALGILQRNTGHLPEAEALFARLARNPAYAAIAWNEAGWAYFLYADFRAAEQAIDRSIALQPYWGNLGLKALLALNWQGDLALAQATIDRMPASALQEDAGAALAVEVSQWQRAPQSTLRILGGLPRDWLHSNSYDGPTALLAGEARQLAKQPEAALGDLRRALDLINQRLADEPNNVHLLGLKTKALHDLGAQADAEKTYHLLREIQDAPPDIYLQALFDPAAAIAGLQSQIAGPPKSASDSAASLRLNPDYDPLRSDPRFQAILARAEADPRRSPQAPENPGAAAPADRPPAAAKP
jgi:cytochrome c-type biogenesis protein CcmH/NrfG